MKADPKPVSDGYCVIIAFDQCHNQRSRLFDSKILHIIFGTIKVKKNKF